ncbi:hypothetical protein PG990_013269 [Apiospora arundinis]|uniref:Uncharacterized protein n=1 Tax=Apiospora arundinis TaxID=335852 RepID=A0ABR2HT24_9PEZI
MAFLKIATRLSVEAFTPFAIPTRTAVLQTLASNLLRFAGNRTVTNRVAYWRPREHCPWGTRVATLGVGLPRISDEAD